MEPQFKNKGIIPDNAEIEISIFNKIFKYFFKDLKNQILDSYEDDYYTIEGTIDQVSTSAPTISFIKNNSPYDITTDYQNVGVYNLELLNAQMSTSNTIIFLGTTKNAASAAPSFVISAIEDAENIRLRTFIVPAATGNNTASDDILENTFFSIKIYK